MATDADDATTALIARMLAEDNAYSYEPQDQYGLDDSEDEDYGGAAKRKRATKRGTNAGKSFSPVSNASLLPVISICLMAGRTEAPAERRQPKGRKSAIGTDQVHFEFLSLAVQAGLSKCS